MRRLLSLLILLHGTLLLGWSQTCPAGNTNIYFGNGVDNTTQKADSSLASLKEVILAQISPPSPQQSINPSCLGFSNAYDTKFFFQNNSSNPLTIFNTLLQFLQAGVVQVLGQQDLSQLWLWSSNPNNAPTWFNQIVEVAALNADAISQPDLQLQVSHYTPDLNNNVKVLVVGHSQGNLYANQVYQELLSPPSNQFSLVSVATPANNVLGADAPYVTLDQDFIQLVPGSLIWNTSNGATPDICNALTLFVGNCSVDAHDFRYSYLAGASSQNKISSDVIDNIPIVLGVSTAGAGGGTVNSSPSGISCASPCTGVQAAFSNGASVTLTASPSAGSIFTGWSGNCSTLASGGGGVSSTITFPVQYDPTGNVITTYPQNCTATFDNSSTTATITSASCIYAGASSVLISASGVSNGPPYATTEFTVPVGYFTEDGSGGPLINTTCSAWTASPGACTNHSPSNGTTVWTSSATIDMFYLSNLNYVTAVTVNVFIPGGLRTLPGGLAYYVPATLIASKTAPCVGTAFPSIN